MRQIYYRMYQKTMYIASYFLKWRQPKRLTGANSVKKLPAVMKKIKLKKVLIVTDKGIVDLGLMDNLIKGLKEYAIGYVIYDKTVPNPTSLNVEEALDMFLKNNCEGIIAFGGGSPMDCAKCVGARVANPKKSLSKMGGVLKVRKKIPLLFAVPTTAGTGSEATIAAVVTDSKTHTKYAVNDLVLIPYMAVLDPILLKGLPDKIKATTGMDALTHAIEAYIGRSNTKQTKQLSKKAVEFIFDNLYLFYLDGNNLNAREKMQKASYYAGIAFTRAYVGYVHAIAHALGGMYGIPHGLANSVVLPYVLDYYGETVYKPLSELAQVAHIGNVNDSKEKKAKAFITSIKELNERMMIPDKLTEIRENDIPELVKRTLKEANPLYPVPKILFEKELTELFYKISCKEHNLDINA